MHRDVTALNDWAFTQDGVVRKIHVDGVFESNSTIAIHAAVLAGLGIAQVASFVVASDLRAGRLVSCLDEFNIGEKPIYAVYPAGRHLSQKVRLFIDYLVDHFAAMSSWPAPAAAKP